MRKEQDPLNNFLRFTVPGQPGSKARHRVQMLKRGNKVFPHIYTPTQTVSFENLVKVSFSDAYPNWVPVTCPVSLHILAKFLFPKTRPKWQHKGLENGNLIIPHNVKPDLDNILKSVTDALNKIVWHDDKQIWLARTEKIYALKPEVYIIIRFHDDDMKEFRQHYQRLLKSEVNYEPR